MRAFLAGYACSAGCMWFIFGCFCSGHHLSFFHFSIPYLERCQCARRWRSRRNLSCSVDEFRYKFFHSPFKAPIRRGYRDVHRGYWGAPYVTDRSCERQVVQIELLDAVCEPGISHGDYHIQQFFDIGHGMSSVYRAIELPQFLFDFVIWQARQESSPWGGAKNWQSATYWHMYNCSIWAGEAPDVHHMVAFRL